MLEGYCGIPAATIHRSIYRQVVAGGVLDYDAGFNRDAPGTIYSGRSLYDKQRERWYLLFGAGRLLDDLVDYCFAIDDTRILFVGDDAQLPPINCTSKNRYGRSLPARLLLTASFVARSRYCAAGGKRHCATKLPAKATHTGATRGQARSQPLLPYALTKGGEVELITGHQLAELVKLLRHRRAGADARVPAPTKMPKATKPCHTPANPLLRLRSGGGRAGDGGAQ